MIIYAFALFICLDVIRSWSGRRAEKQHSILLMGLPTADNDPVLFPFSWLAHATRCARKAKRYSYFYSLRPVYKRKSSSAFLITEIIIDWLDPSARLL